MGPKEMRPTDDGLKSSKLKTKLTFPLFKLITLVVCCNNENLISTITLFLKVSLQKWLNIILSTVRGLKVHLLLV
jgi:hypothetical protein